ncbi:hypothetical protein ACW73L_09755 [Methylolobus aquaticus]|uniref:hypothetical protein n=1 Tax=Methylotetracoccus oryzae TaxID=1919059 RepID=UPI00111A9982|nr:hypothetical protein [Methylotetracoccus oryzae]
MKNEITKKLGIALVTGFFGLTVGVASAAENAEGVKEHMALTVKTTQEALAAASAGNGEGCVTSIKQAIQHYKEITGDAAGKPLQDTIKKIKAAKDACAAGDPAEGAAVLKDAVADLEKIQAAAK